MLRSDQPFKKRPPLSASDDFFWNDLDHKNPFEYDDEFIADIMQQILHKTTAFVRLLKEAQQNIGLEALSAEVDSYKSYIAILNYDELISTLDTAANSAVDENHAWLPKALKMCEALMQQLRAELSKLGRA